MARLPDADSAAQRLAIADMLARYAEAVDILGNSPVAAGAQDSALIEAVAAFERCLLPHARLSLFLAGPQGPSTIMGAGGPAAFASAVRAYFTAYGYVGTHHHPGSATIRFDGRDRAMVFSSISCYHFLADGRMLFTPVRYEDAAVRESGTWKISERNIFAGRFWVAEGYFPDPLDPSLGRRAPAP